MTEVFGEKGRLADEVRRRLRLARLPRMTVMPFEGDEFDVRVLVSPPNAELAAEVLALCPDVRITVLQGVWRRA